MMRTVSHRRWLLAAGLALGLAGCNRQDTDTLARLGRKVLDRTHGATQEMRDRLDLRATAPEPALADRVQARLRWDRALADTAIAVTGHDREVALTGSVRTPDQRARAVELAETTAGVEKLTDKVKDMLHKD